MQTLIWDFDGTLGYREGGMFSAALAEIACRESPDSGVTADFVRPYLQSGFPWHSPNRPHLDITSAAQWWDAVSPVFERAFRELGFDETQARSLARQVRGVYSDPARWRLFDDVIPTFGRLSGRGWTHVLLSNHVPELSEIVHQLKLGPHLAGIFNSAETGYEKPHPQAFLNVLEAVGSPTAVWMIGDSYAADVSGAEAVGIPAILVRRTHAKARYACDELTQVPAIVSG